MICQHQISPTRTTHHDNGPRSNENRVINPTHGQQVDVRLAISVQFWVCQPFVLGASWKKEKSSVDCGWFITLSKSCLGTRNHTTLSGCHYRWRKCRQIGEGEPAARQPGGLGAGRPAAGWPVLQGPARKFSPLKIIENPLPPYSRATRCRPPGSGEVGVYTCKFRKRKYIFVKNEIEKCKNKKIAGGGAWFWAFAGQEFKLGFQASLFFFLFWWASLAFLTVGYQAFHLVERMNKNHSEIRTGDVKHVSQETINIFSHRNKPKSVGPIIYRSCSCTTLSIRRIM